MRIAKELKYKNYKVYITTKDNLYGYEIVNNLSSPLIRNSQSYVDAFDTIEKAIKAAKEQIDKYTPSENKN